MWLLAPDCGFERPRKLPNSGPGEPGRDKLPVYSSGAGDTEIAALVDLHGRLAGMPRPVDDAAKRDLLNRRLREAFYAGADVASLVSPDV